MPSAFDVQQRLWRRYCERRDEVIHEYGYKSTKTTRLISLAWITYRRSLREHGIMLTESGWRYRKDKQK